ncbi:MAG TPA: GNAT family N-acetyltransferase [Bryobacteraceae bacterium]|nr:GNAT family N-acetyltransferase [Bryobacteraceae bacterium]
MATDHTPLVRKATPADAEAILQLVDALADYEQLPRPDAEARKRLIQDAFAERPRFESLLCEIAGRPVGYAFYFETYSSFLALPTLYLEDLFVLPDHRGRQAGYLLFKAAVQEAADRGCGRMEWTVLHWNQLAIDFYHRSGATHMKEWLLYRLVADEFDRI